MSSHVRRSSHLSRHLSALRLQRGLRPGQLAAALGASNVSKVGSLIRGFELGEPLSDHWFEKLIAVLQPDPTELRRCLELDQAEAAEQLECERIAWEAWADEPIDPFLTIRYMPAVYGVREVPQAFCTPRESAEDREWARQRAEDWAAAELKRFRAKGFLNWSRRERTWYDERGVNPRRRPVTFEEPSSQRSAATLALARRHGLSSYDATYLELAQRLGAALASFDRQLNEAARASDVALYPEPSS